MIEFDEYKVKLNNLKPGLTALGTSLKLDDAERELEELRAATEAPEFWSDVQGAQKNQQRTKLLEGRINRYTKLQSTWDDLYTICEMALEENDESAGMDIVILAALIELKEKRGDKT